MFGKKVFNYRNLCKIMRKFCEFWARFIHIERGQYCRLQRIKQVCDLERRWLLSLLIFQIICTFGLLYHKKLIRKFTENYLFHDVFHIRCKPTSGIETQNMRLEVMCTGTELPRISIKYLKNIWNIENLNLCPLYKKLRKVGNYP